MTTELHRTNINLFLADVEYLRKKFGHGWSEQVRHILHADIERSKAKAPVRGEISRRYIDNTEVP